MNETDKIDGFGIISWKTFDNEPTPYVCAERIDTHVTIIEISDDNVVIERSISDFSGENEIARIELPLSVMLSVVDEYNRLRLEIKDDNTP